MQMACFYHTFEHLDSTDLWSEQGSPLLLSGEAQAVPGDYRHRDYRDGQEIPLLLLNSNPVPFPGSKLQRRHEETTVETGPAS